MRIRAHVLPVYQVLYSVKAKEDAHLKVVVEVFSAFVDVVIGFDLEEGLPWEFRKSRVLGSQVSIQLVKLTVAFGKLPLPVAQFHYDLVEYSWLPLV